MPNIFTLAAACFHSLHCCEHVRDGGAERQGDAVMDIETGSHPHLIAFRFLSHFIPLFL